MGKETQNISVGGMSCQHCVHAVKSAVGALAGVAGVEVDLLKNLVTVEFDPGTIGLPAIKTAIEDQGYTVA
jgi:copper chaperone